MAFSISGLVSGLDWSSMISKLVELERRPIKLLEDKQGTLSEKKSAWSQVNTKLLSLKTAASSLSSLDDFKVFKPTATITGTSSEVGELLGYTVGSNASEGSYNIVVNHRATAEKLASTSFGSARDALGISGSVIINDQELSIDTTDSLVDIQQKINAMNSGDHPVDVTASIITVSDSEYRLTLTSRNTGVDGISISDGEGSDVLSQFGFTEIVAGRDAEITFDGFTITRSSNQITDVISGVTLNLLGEDEDATITLNVTRDNDGIKEKIQDFVDSYNDLMSFIAEQNVVSEDGETSGVLFGDASLLSVKSTIRNVVLSGVSGLDSSLDHLSLIGINIDKTGQLSIDDEKLDGYLETNFQDVMDLFAAQGSSTTSSLTYIASGRNTKAGDYEVEITQTATRAVAAGSGFSGLLSSDAVLTLTSSSGRERSITLSAGWDITAIVNAINGDDTLGVTAEDDGGQLRITSDSYGTQGNFTLSVSGGNLGLVDGEYTGLDVSGRIRASGSGNWMTMTGTGQILVGDDGQDVEGLRIKYTGTSTGTFDFTFIKGIGELLDQTLYFMTDSLDGYVANKQEALQTQMDNIDKKIERMEARLTKYEESLNAKYAAMETMLSTLQSQQSWLTSQLSSLNS